MRNLPLPSRDRSNELLRLALHGYYDVTEAEIGAVESLYNAYEDGRGAPGEVLKGTTLDEQLKAAILSAYGFTREGRRLSEIRKELFKNVRLCPSCGISAPRTLDHHLPKEIYRPLAIFERNLVPMCGECNGYKSQNEGLVITERFYNPYFQELPNVRFLRARVNIEGGALDVEFDIDPEAQVTAEMIERLSFQFSRLRLDRRYVREVINYMSAHVTALENSFRADQAHGVREYLIAQANNEFGWLHINHWRPVLLTAFSECVRFCSGGFRDVLPQPPLNAPVVPAE